jgi:single-stranded-DNA-specific exonuclease
MQLFAAPPKRRWTVAAPPDPGAVERLSRELNLPEALCALLVLRGHAEPIAARAFLRPGPEQLHAPDFAGIGDAVERLRRAIGRGETVLVHGDYDVDGICATAIYVRALRMLGGRAEPFTPHRLRDGYDLTDAGVEAAASIGASLILTGDCGIVAYDAVATARRAGIDVVVTDHHTPGPTLPAAVAVVNPNRAGCPYPNKYLCGAAVAYKVCVALAREVGFPEERLTALIDLVAIATVADLVPLEGENRVLVRWGLRVLQQTPNAGLRALLRSTKLDEKSEISAGHVGFVLAPRLNAVGRMGDAGRGVRLLLTDDPREAEAIAAELEIENSARKEEDGRTLREAMQLLEREYDPARDRGIVLAKAGWHPGVIGIVASRIVERIHRPTVMIALEPGGEGKGSGRSISGFDLHGALTDCSEHLIRFGGHKGAAGCSIRADRVDAFRAAFNARAARELDDEKLTPEVKIDVEIALEAADGHMCRLLRHAAPFGLGNPTPTFVAKGVEVAGYPRIVGREHLKLTLAAGAARLDAIGFGMGERLGDFNPADGPFDVAFKLEENEWNGRTRPQARLVDGRPALFAE